jgi:hypothetical protein
LVEKIVLKIFIEMIKGRRNRELEDCPCSGEKQKHGIDLVT